MNEQRWERKRETKYTAQHIEKRKKIYIRESMRVEYMYAGVLIMREYVYSDGISCCVCVHVLVYNIQYLMRLPARFIVTE